MATANMKIPAECYLMRQCFLDQQAEMDKLIDNSYQWLSSFTADTLDFFKANGEAFAPMIFKQPRRRKRISKQENDASSGDVFVVPPKRRSSRVNRQLEQLVIMNGQPSNDIIRSPATQPIKPPRLRANTRLASINASKKISLNFIAENALVESEEIEGKQSFNLPPVLWREPIEEFHDEVPYRSSAVAKKVNSYESKMSTGVRLSISMPPQLTPVLAIVAEDIFESPPSTPSLQISSASLNLTPSKTKFLPTVTCTPLNLNKLVRKKTSTGGYLLAPTLLQKYPGTTMMSYERRLSARRSSAARYINRGVAKKRASNSFRLSSGLRASMEKSKIDDDGNNTDRSDNDSHEDYLPDGADKENQDENVVPSDSEDNLNPKHEKVAEHVNSSGSKLVATLDDNKQDNGYVKSSTSGENRGTQLKACRLSIMLTRLKQPQPSKATVTATLAQSANKHRAHNASADHPLMRNVSRSSGYSSSDGKRVQPYLCTPNVDKKYHSAQRLRTCTQNSEMEMKRLEAIKLKEQKWQSNLKKREEAIKKAINEKKRTREERLRSAIKIREEREKQKQIRLKEQEDEQKRIQAAANKKREQEELERQIRLAEQRRMHEIKQAERERERKLQAEADLQAEKQARLRREEKERQELERDRLEHAAITRAKEQQRREQEKELNQGALAKDRLKKEAERNVLNLKVSVTNHSPKDIINLQKKLSSGSYGHKEFDADSEADNEHPPSTEEATKVKKTTATALNTTVTLNIGPSTSKPHCTTYEITPPRDITKTLPLKNPNNYNITDLNQEDSTDDESHPKKEIPSWAQGRELKLASMKQYRSSLYKWIEIFPPKELLLPLKLTELFSRVKARYNNRTSSANWSSPIYKGGTPGSSTPNT